MQQVSSTVSERNFPRDRIVVVGGSDRTLDFLRLVTIRSDDVVLIGTCDAAARRFAQRFAIEVRTRALEDLDLAEANAVLIKIGDPEVENAVVRSARRFGVPVHVADRELVSDFKLLAFLERRPVAAQAA